MPAKDINKIQALKDEAFVEGDVDEDFLERFAEETGWKSVLLYQYLSGYIVMIAMTALITTAIAWLELMHSIVTPYPTDEQMSEGNFLQLCELRRTISDETKLLSSTIITLFAIMMQIHMIILVMLFVYGVNNSTGSHFKKRETHRNCTKRQTLRYDDGNVMEDIESPNLMEEEPKIQTKEKGTHQFGRTLIQPFVDVAAKTVSRIGKAFDFVTKSTGLDTNSSFIGQTTSGIVGGTIDGFKNRVKMIYPGTRWCGDGDKAKSEDDLGTFKATDKCCRAHDKCFDSIIAGDTKHGLHNTGLFTRSHCDCDHDFFYCLKNSTELVSKKIGFTYFSILGPQCFKEESFVTGCIHYSRGKCIEYKTDPTKGKMFQWFDSPIFIG